jgi:hypothetical protein
MRIQAVGRDANWQTVPISPVQKASESDAHHSSSRRLMLESAAFTFAMSARATSTLSRPHFPLGQPGAFGFAFSGQRIERPRLWTLHRNDHVNLGQRASKMSVAFFVDS